jgi:hypothetical protein
METLEVTARFTPAGKIIPLRFARGKTRIKVHSTGRQWEDEEGKHILVMDAQRKTYHLIFHPGTFTWRLQDKRSHPNFPI